ncbi:MAG: helix-turn-helix domain-containing protein [Luminiphilus sp.]|nr:helix-turn-helix domain-containing protein [Luminiphilus sp.]
MSNQFLCAIRAQQKAQMMFERPKRRPDGQFKRQLSDDQIKAVMKMHADGKSKKAIASATHLNVSTIYNITHRYLVEDDGSVTRRKDIYEY